jgi:hypothetical protein
MAANMPKMTIAKPLLFTSRACWISNLFSLVCLIPLAVALALSALAFVFAPPVFAGVFSLFALMASFFCVIYFLPTALANPYVKKLVESHRPEAGNASHDFISQIALSPRLYSGIRGFIEDADDVGRLQIAETDLCFEGDSIELRVPLHCITRVKKRNPGWRALWIGGPRITVSFSGLPQIHSVEFCERSALTLVSHRKRAARMFKDLSTRISKPMP